LTADAADLAARLKARARAEGFAAAGICAPDALPDAPARLARFLALGRHGQMGWMAAGRLAGRPAGAVAAGAVGRHAGRSLYPAGRSAGHADADRARRDFGLCAGAGIKVFVDTAPVMEKPLAQAAGLGWQGKHTNLLSRELGNWFFLGAIFTTAELADAPEATIAAPAAPASTSARPMRSPRPYQLDARRCISYLTIEHKGPVDCAGLRRWATASMAATIAWPCAPGTSLPVRRARRS
jgi:epoxyqueuosine reductase